MTPMASIRSGAALRQIQSLYGAGTCSGLPDEQLLERYLAGRGERAEAAFAALVERHGPMVLRVCRAVLRDGHDAEDAFQAVFLVLARQAGSIRRRGSLESWLFGVASRVSRCARAGAARRRWHERRRAERTAEAVADALPDELGAVIQREVGRLPDRLRAAVVLCYFEGRTCEQAADRLGLPVGTIKSRLSGARARLRSRLARDGYGPEAANPAAWPLAGPFVVPARLASSTIASVMASPASRSASGGGVSASVAVLAQGALRGILLSRTMAGAALVLAVAALAWAAAAAGAGGRGPAEERPSPSPPPAAAPSASGRPFPGRTEPDQMTLAGGIVVDPDGRPLAGASVRLMILGGWSGRPDLRTTSGPDGQFLLSLPRDDPDRLAQARAGTLRVVATAPGHGLGWADPRFGENLLVPLVTDQPIEGRIVDAQGRPIAGVRVKTHNAWSPPRTADLAAFIEDVKRRGEAPWTGARPLKLVSHDAAATTDADGRFLLEGIGRERVAALTISGPTIVTEDIYAMTRVGPAVRPVGWEGLEPGARTYLGARFEHAAAPCTPIAGTVRDIETGKPIAGIKVRADVESVEGRADHPGASATTNDRGCYVLTGLPPDRKMRLRASSTRGLPYVGREMPVTAKAATGKPASCDIGLRKGVLIRGRITDTATGQPVRGSVAYFPFPDNPQLEEYPAGGHQGAAGGDGRFEIAVPPCRGVLIAHASGGRYVRAVGADKIKGLDRIPDLFGRPYRVAPDYQLAVEVSPAVGVDPVTRDLQLVPARTVTGTVVDPDGKPVIEAVAMGLDANMFWADRVLMSADFAVADIDPGSPRRVSFFHVGRRLAGSVLIKGDEASPLSVRLQPWGTVTGRIVDDRGRPQSAMVLTGSTPNRSELDSGTLPRRATVGPDGRFRFEGLVPGLRYSASVLDEEVWGRRWAFRGLQVGRGETRDLGDIKLQRDDPGKDR
jgi:RNA polymerase sigma factor (sigma-70 family)